MENVNAAIEIVEQYRQKYDQDIILYKTPI
jgi:hypothetical protein